ncbi:MAG TPA: hypothetical protein VI503_01180, partial [Gaiellaceae bacterium]|nr:hypothetical protein [Gaiellaceae bacterium]
GPGGTPRPPSPRAREPRVALLCTMKQAAAALRDAGLEFMLGSGLDFFVRPEDAERGLEALVASGMRAERPPEDWLVKAWDGSILVDLIFGPAGGPVTEEHFARATAMEVSAQSLLVASIARTSASPFARAFFTLARGLGIAEPLEEPLEAVG